MKLSVSNLRHYPVRISDSVGMPKASSINTFTCMPKSGRTYVSGFAQAMIVGQVQ
jgi:hypothetical protein